LTRALAPLVNWSLAVRPDDLRKLDFSFPPDTQFNRHLFLPFLFGLQSFGHFFYFSRYSNSLTLHFPSRHAPFQCASESPGSSFAFPLSRVGNWPCAPSSNAASPFPS